MSEEFSTLDTIRECPICGRELDKGYLIESGPVRWDIKKHKYWGGGSEKLTPIPLSVISKPSYLKMQKMQNHNL